MKIPNLEQNVAIFPKGTGTRPVPKRVRKIPEWRLIMKSFLWPFSPYRGIKCGSFNYWRMDVHEVLVKRLGLSQPRKSGGRLTDRVNMTLVVDWQVKQQNKQTNQHPWASLVMLPNSCLHHGIFILAHQTRFSMIFTSADKSYLTYPYLTRGIDKNRKPTHIANTLVV